MVVLTRQLPAMATRQHSSSSEWCITCRGEVKCNPGQLPTAFVFAATRLRIWSCWRSCGRRRLRQARGRRVVVLGLSAVHLQACMCSQPRCDVPTHPLEMTGCRPRRTAALC